MTKKESLYKVRAAKVVVCPHCKNNEDHPTMTNSLGKPLKLIIAHKETDKHGVWWSHCLVCAGFFDKDLKPIIHGLGRKTKGWFRTPQSVASVMSAKRKKHEKRK